MLFATDILGLGAVAVDDLVYVDAYPPPNAKVQIHRRVRQAGGLTATALVAARRLGVRCAYAGVLGKDELSNYSIQTLQQEGIDLTCLKQNDLARPAYSTIIVDETHQTRNIFVDLQGVVGAAEDWPPTEVIHNCRVLFVDHIGMPGMLRAARIARSAGIPIVADIESDSPLFPELLHEVDHLILSWEFARQYTGQSVPGKALICLREENQSVVAITCGEEGCWFLSDALPKEPHHQPAFPVKVVDTTGCGDVFHGAYAAALVRGLDITERFRFASAAAAMKATRRGGQAGAPTISALETFLKEQG